MSEVMTDVEAVDEVALDLALKFAPLISRMRAEGRFNVETFLRAFEAGMGGTLALEAPCSRQQRIVPEARYVSEGVQLAAGGTQRPFGSN